MADLDFENPLARALWLARRDATTIEPPAAGELTLERTDRVAAELYGAIEAGGGRQVGWKIGAGDAGAQARFGTDRPFTAPVYDSSCLQVGATLRLAGLVAPRLEAEIGEPRPSGPEVRAMVRRDGEVVAEGAGAVDSAVAAVREALGDQRLAAVPLVASGSLITPVPLEPGRHEVDFGQLGTLRLEVTA